MPQQIKRTLDYFAKGEDELVGQLELKNLPSGFLQGLFDLPADDPMYEVLPVGPETLESLRPYVVGELDTEKFDYYLDASAVGFAGKGRVFCVLPKGQRAMTGKDVERFLDIKQRALGYKVPENLITNTSPTIFTPRLSIRLFATKSQADAVLLMQGLEPAFPEVEFVVEAQECDFVEWPDEPLSSASLQQFLAH